MQLKSIYNQNKKVERPQPNNRQFESNKKVFFCCNARKNNIPVKWIAFCFTFLIICCFVWPYKSVMPFVKSNLF